MRTQALVDLLNVLLPDVTVAQGTNTEEIPDNYCLITRMPGGAIQMEGAGQITMFSTLTRAVAFDPQSTEDLAMDVDRVFLGLSGATVDGHRIVYVDRSGAPGNTNTDDGERSPWSCTYEFLWML